MIYVTNYLYIVVRFFIFIFHCLGSYDIQVYVIPIIFALVIQLYCLLFYTFTLFEKPFKLHKNNIKINYAICYKIKNC